MYIHRNNAYASHAVNVLQSLLCFSDVSADEAFVDELRVNLRFVAAVALRRLQKVSLLQRRRDVT